MGWRGLRKGCTVCTQPTHHDPSIGRPVTSGRAHTRACKTQRMCACAKHASSIPISQYIKAHHPRLQQAARCLTGNKRGLSGSPHTVGAYGRQESGGHSSCARRASGGQGTATCARGAGGIQEGVAVTVKRAGAPGARCTKVPMLCESQWRGGSLHSTCAESARNNMQSSSHRLWRGGGHMKGH